MLEMVTRLTDGRWLDMGGHRLLLDRCDGMERSAFVDPLTGAYTRRYFDKFLASGEMQRRCSHDRCGSVQVGQRQLWASGGR